MARDIKDSKTIDPFEVKKRGRPTTGTAKTRAEITREKRERERLAILTARTPRDYAELSTPVLVQAISVAVAEGVPKTVKIIADILADRAKQNFDAVQ